MTDGEAIERTLAGDDEAFRVLVERYARAVHRIAARITGHAEDAEDVVQESMIRAYQRLSTFERRSSFATWLHQIAVRCALDLIDSRRRRREQQDSEEVPMIDRIEDQEALPDRRTLGAEARERVAAALGLLTSNEHTAFVMRHCEGMSIREIGSALGTNDNATKNTIFRAVKKLRAELEPFVRSAS